MVPLIFILENSMILRVKRDVQSSVAIVPTTTTHAKDLAIRIVHLIVVGLKDIFFVPISRMDIVPSRVDMRSQHESGDRITDKDDVLKGGTISRLFMGLVRVTQPLR